MKNKLAIVVTFSLLLLQGCQNLGHNTSYLLQFKKEVRQFYALEELDCNEVVDRFAPFPEKSYDKNIFMKCDQSKFKEELARHGPRESLTMGHEKESPEELMRDRSNHLAKIYSSILPFIATDHYVIRTISRPIRAGDPLNVIINKIHLKWNGEFLSKIDTGEIAVVITVDDGKAEEPRHVMVAYETGICNDIDLPIGDLLAYSTDSYGDEPIRIEVTVLDLDQEENRAATDILNAAAEAGKFFQPAFAPAYSIAAKVGKLLLEAHKDDIIVKMTFQLYPWQTGDSGRVSGHIGVPKVGEGRYLIVNTPSAGEMKEKDSSIVEYRNTIHANYDLQIYSVDVDPTKFKRLASTVEEKGEEAKDGEGKPSKKLRKWPPLLSDKDGEKYEEESRKPLDSNYVVLTVSSSPLSSAGIIISRLDTVNRAAAGMMQHAQLNPKTADGLNAALDDVKGLIKRVAIIDEFQNMKTNPEALRHLFDAYEGKNSELKDKDKASILLLIRKVLPCMSKNFIKDIESKFPAELQSEKTWEKWYERIKGHLVYDQTTGLYDYMRPLSPDGNDEKCYLSPS